MSWRAGVASVKVTPTEPLWLAGWALRKEPAKGTFSELYASALVLEDELENRLVLSAIDLIATPRWLCDPIADAISRRHSIPRENFLFNASHTHCAPEIR